MMKILQDALCAVWSRLVWPDFFRARIVGAILAGAIVAACGGGGGGSGGGESDGIAAGGDAERVCRPIPNAAIDEVIPHLDGDKYSGDALPYPTAGDMDFQTHSVFPTTDETRALIRSADGCNYVYLERQAAAGTRTAATVHIWRFATGITDLAVSDNVASLSLVADSANSGVAVKGARSDVQRFNLSGDLLSYQADAYIFETRYSGFGIWLEHPDDLFGDGDYAHNPLFNIYGLATPSGDMPAAGAAQYRGVAAGFYARDIPPSGRIAPGDRFFVGGEVILHADFANGDINGSAGLRAYNRDFSAAAGAVNITLSGGKIHDRIFVGDTFHGKTGIHTAGTGVFDGLTGAASGDSSFYGIFTGANADEAVGGADLKITDADGGADGVLEFGFITEKQPPR